MAGVLRVAGALVAFAGLAACAPSARLVREAPVDDPGAARRAALATWQVTGRIAVSDGRDGGSGRVDWRQDGAAYDITVNAPLAGGSWRLSGDATLAQLDGVGAEPRRDRDAESLLARELGWHLPVARIVAWMRGVPGEPGAARIAAGPDGLPRRLREAGWEVEYKAWAEVEGLALPRRLVARRPPFEVRIAVDRWVLHGSG
jgi:outer membrane lipoprotein LolB